MSKEMELSMEEPVEVERLGRRLAQAAATRPGLIANAMRTWDVANPDRPAAALLGGSDDALWRVAVTPRPTGQQMVAQAQLISAELGVNVVGLLNILRFADSTESFASANDDGEMLMAALDSDHAESEDND